MSNFRIYPSNQNQPIIIETESGIINTVNSSDVPLNSGETFIGTSSDVSNYSSMTISVLTDTNSTIYVQFSTDETNWDSNLNFEIIENVSFTTTILINRKYTRVVLTNTSNSNQSFLRLQVLTGNQITDNIARSGMVSSDNSSTTLLENNETFTGLATDVSLYNTIMTPRFIQIEMEYYIMILALTVLIGIALIQIL